MGPTRKSRSVNKRYTYGSEASPSKDADSAKRSNSRKRKLVDMLGPRWTTDELTRFYDAYRKSGKDWKKVAAMIKNRSPDMVEALYTMNRAYLSLPHGTASAAGLIAMMTDHYSNMARSDSEADSGAGSSRKPKRARGKAQSSASRSLEEQFDSLVPPIMPNYGSLPFNKKKRTGGGRPRPVGKRTPRFPVSFSYEKSYFSPPRQGLEIKADENEDEVHEIAAALAEVSQRGGSPQVSGTPSKRGESVMSSPFRNTLSKDSLSDMDKAKHLAPDMDEEDLEGSTETGELSMQKPYMTESVNRTVKRVKGRSLEGKKIEVDSNNENHLDDIKEECSGTDEGQRLGAAKANDTNMSKSPIQSQRKKSKKVLFRRDEAFDALQTLADLSLMMPSENEEESKLQFKDEHHDHVDESVPSEVPQVNQPRERRKSSGVRTKGHLISSTEVAPRKTSKSGKGDVSSIREENQDSHQPIPKLSRRKQKTQVAKVEKTESDPDAVHVSESLGIETGDGGKKSMAKSKKTSQSSSPNLTRISENFSSADPRKEGSDSTLSGTQVLTVNEANLTTRVRSKRKMGLKKPQVQKDLKFPETISNDQSNIPFSSLLGTTFNFKEKLLNCLSNQRVRRWCTYEWFYSAIDYPWFAKREFVEYLYHVGLGHVPRLTRVEWGVIRSSLGKPRRFSEEFLKEEKEKLNQYRESVRKHYTELREGLREGLPTDLAKPLSVGQRVIAIHPKTREIHDGSVLTVDHSKCRVQFDRHDLGVEFVMDIDCMPLNPFENMPALLGRHVVSVDKFFENFNELKINGQAKDYIKLSPGDNLDNINGAPQMSASPNTASLLLKQTKVASSNPNVQTNIGLADAAAYHQLAYSQAAGTVPLIQAREADVQALAELSRALDKKDAIVRELKLMNEDVLESQNDNENPLKDSENFKKQYAAVLVLLNEANAQVQSALHCLRERNTYQGKCQVTVPRPVSSFADTGGMVNTLDGSAGQINETGSHVHEIMDSSRAKARTMVDAAMQAISSLKNREDTFEKIEEAIDYVNEHLPSDGSFIPMASNLKSTNASDMEAQIPSELITKCVATLLMIQKCTERQFPPSDVAQILDSAVTSLQPRSSQNLPVYTEIQKCVGIIKNQILALIPT